MDYEAMLTKKIMIIVLKNMKYEGKLIKLMMAYWLLSGRRPRFEAAVYLLPPVEKRASIKSIVKKILC
jgi:hypothetical protein